ncbi:MAG: hypothetical protein R3Y35_14775 [Clostridia bacterium]
MVKNTYMPSANMMVRIQAAVNAVASQTERKVKCPICLHNTIIVYEDTRGHVKTKCKKCKNEVVIDVLSMRKGQTPLLFNLY